MGKNPIPDDADPVLREVLGAIRRGDNPDHKRIAKLDKDKQKQVQQALAKRKGKHRRGGDGDVINTGMFD